MSNKTSKEKHNNRQGKLSRQDRELWDRVTGNVERLKAGKGSDPSESSQSSGFKSGHESDESFEEQLTGSAKSDAIAEETASNDGRKGTNEQRRGSPELAKFDRREAKQLSGGRLEIEARLDLHGYRQSEAHSALKQFLLGSQSRGLRHVLVITGKGREQEEENFYDEKDKGVLRRQVPAWLEEPEFRPLVVSYSTAGRRHGGDGAFYVRLRRQKSG